MTPGQAAYEAFCRVFQNESWGPWDRLLPEPMIPEDDPRAGWEQIAQAVIASRDEEVLSDVMNLRELVAEILGEFSSGFLVAATNTTASKASGWYKRAGLEQP